MGLWIGWNDREKYINMIIGVFMLFLIKQNNIKLDLSKRNVISTIFAILGFTYFSIRMEYFGLSVPFSYFLPVSLIILLNSADKIRCVSYISRWFAYLIIPSVITYLLYQAIGLPSFGELLVSDNVDQPYEYTHRVNYLFYCYADFYDIRFNGPFVEPGHLGMMSAFLLMVTGFNFRKWETWAIIIGILFTLSLSGYMLAVIGYLLYKFGEGKIKIKMVLSFLIFILIVVYIAFTYNNGDNLLFEFIISRLEPDEENGFSGNNRVFGQIDLFFAGLFTDFKLLLFGYDTDTIKYLSASGSRGTGLIMCMVKYGLFGTILGLLFYFIYGYYSNYRRKAFVLLLFVIITYWQRTYPFWFSWIICYVYGMTLIEKEKSLLKYENRNSNLSQKS